MSAPGFGLSRAAAENVYECGVDVQGDIDDLRAGRETPASLLALCLDGADEDREQGWREYVERVAQIAGVRS